MQTVSEIVTKEKAAIRREAENKRRGLRVLEDVASVWPAEVPVTSIHAYSLYGSSARVTIGQSFVPYGAADDRCTMADVARLLDRFLPLPLWKIKGGNTSFRPDPAVTDDEAMKENAEQVWGVLLDVEPGHNAGGAQQSVEWYTAFGALVLRIECILAPAAYPVRTSVEGPRQFGKGKLLRVTDTRIEAQGNFWLDQRVKWAAGSSEYANKFTCYWLGIDDSQGVGKAWLEQVCGMDTE